MSTEPADSPRPSSEVPRENDSSHEHTDQMKRRNRITAFVIVAFLVFWILLGLRHALFGGA